MSKALLGVLGLLLALCAIPIACIMAARIPDAIKHSPHKTMILIVLIGAASLYLCLLAIEVWLGLKQGAKVRKHCAAFGITETRQDVTNRLGLGKSLSLSPNGRWFQVLQLPLPRDWPIGTYPLTECVGFRELEGWPIHKTDRFGFFNEDAWWDDEPEVLIVGDSFVACEHLQSTSLTKLVRERGVRAVNLGLTGTGPYVQLAALRAYLPHVKHSVKLVVWCYYEGNDLQDARDEAGYFKCVLDPSWIGTPDPKHLAELPSSDNLFGFGYKVRTALRLTRTRLAFSVWRGSPHDVALYQRALSEAVWQSDPADFVLIRICKPGARMDRQWATLQAPHKLAMPNRSEFHSKGIETAHYTVEAYNVLARAIVEFYEHELY